MLARLLTSSLGDLRARDAADALLARFGDMASAVTAPTSEILRTLKDDGEACSVGLADLRAVVMAVLKRRMEARPVIGTGPGLRAYVLAALADERREQLRVLYLDKRNALILEEVCAIGARDHVPVYPREIVRRALDLAASALILVHNHPSGDPQPSAADILMTDQVVAACSVFEIDVHDHVVVGRGQVFSFDAAGLLPRGDTRFEHSQWLTRRRSPPRHVPARGRSQRPAGATLQE